MDSTIDPGTDQQSAADTNELPVALDTLEVGGVRPQVGDMVDVTVNGKVLKIVNDIAIVQPEKANNQPIPQPPPENELDDLAKQSQGVMLDDQGY